MLFHVDRQWHSSEPKHTDQELYKLIWETWDFLGIRTKCPSPFSFFIKYWATSLYGWNPSYPSRLGNKSLQKPSKEQQRDRWGLLVSLVGQLFLGTSRSLCLPQGMLWRCLLVLQGTSQIIWWWRKVKLFLVVFKTGRDKMLPWGFPGGASGKKPACQCRRLKEMWTQSLDQEDLLEEGMATHPSILAWRIPWTEEPGRLQATGSQRVGHHWSNLPCMQ